MPKVTILWGANLAPGDEARTYEFATQEELAAFMQGVDEMDGWHAYREVEEGYVVPEEGWEEI